jgi:UDPglucose 6-dehydrogenase
MSAKVAVIGAGYVGLTSAACFAHLGHDVVCADVNEARVRRLEKGDVPILEAGLSELVAEGLDSGRLRFVVGAANAARDAEFVFLCVPTPFGDGGGADLSVVEDVVREIAPVLQPGTVIVNKSTMPVGSTLLVTRVLGQNGAANDIGVASNPEFLREAHAVRDFLHCSRIVIGCDDTAIAVRVSELYKGLQAPLLVTDPASAEMIKYASNAFLATKISFVNAIANLCEAVNADVRDVALGMGYDPRIGSEFLQAGPGYGGSCLPKDVAALVHTAAEAGYDFALLRGVVEVNEQQRERVIAKIAAGAGGSLAGVRIAVWGLTFKANTDDLRDSPALAIVARLVADGAEVRAYDPILGDPILGTPAASEAPAATRVPGVDVVTDPYDAAEGASLLTVLTEWHEFRWLDFSRVYAGMTDPHAIVDARNLLDPAAMRRLGFAYEGVGR